MGAHVCRCSAESPHPTFGACIRAKGLRIGYSRSAAGWDATREKAWTKDLDAYSAAKRQGVQPAGTSRRQVEAAMQASDMTGMAYGATG